MEDDEVDVRIVYLLVCHDAVIRGDVFAEFGIDEVFDRDHIVEFGSIVIHHITDDTHIGDDDIFLMR